MRTSVASRELKTRLGVYLRRVRGGATLLVTDRGKPVAELRPLDATGQDAGLGALVALGVVTRNPKARLAPFRPLRSSGGLAAQAVIEGREDRL